MTPLVGLIILWLLLGMTSVFLRMFPAWLTITFALAILLAILSIPAAAVKFLLS